MHFVMPVVCLVLTAFCSLSSAAPREAWRFEALSNLYAPPLVADIVDVPGQEIIIADSEAKRLRCVNATGEQLWECDGGWAKRLISPPALSDPFEDGKRLLSMANGDGSLVCIDASNGQTLWRRDIAPVEWGGTLWTRLEADGAQAVIVGTERGGVSAWSAEGQLVWEFPADATTPPLHIRGALAAADVTGDGSPEIFGASAFGLFALNARGELLWEQYTGDDFPGAPVVADVDNDGNAEVFAVSKDDHFLWCLDANTSAPVWRAPLYGPPDSYSASSIAIGDITGDGRDEIVVGDGHGHVCAFRHDGSLLWLFKTEKSVAIAVSLGDVNGDGRVQVLAASGDHHLYCLDERGLLQWRYAAGLRLIYPATLTDLTGDGMTDILLCGSDGVLRCLTLGGRYAEARMPWPSRRFDMRQSGSAYQPGRMGAKLIERSEALPFHGDFELGRVRDGLEQFDESNPFHETLMSRPRGWRAKDAFHHDWGLSEEWTFSGARALRLGAAMSVESYPLPIPPTLRRVTANVCFSGSGTGIASLRWLGTLGILREDRFVDDVIEGNWLCLRSTDAIPPQGARWLVVALESDSGPAFWDALDVVGFHEERAAVTVLVNQAGYDLEAPARFVVQSNFRAENARFELVNAGGETVFADALLYEGRIQGHFGNDWGYHYYSGDFTTHHSPGAYRIHAILDAVTDFSYPFVRDRHRLWNATALPAIRFFYYQRCGMAIPGYYEACHLDDAVGPDGETQYDLWGGWHDAGDYNKYHNAPYVYGLATAYMRQQERFDLLGEAPTGFSLFFDEILWGADHVRRMVMNDGSAFGHITSGYGFWGPPYLETDNLPGTGDERRGTREGGDNPDAHLAAVARVTSLLEGRPAANTAFDVWTETGERSLRYALSKNRRGLWLLSGALDLWEATGDARHREQAEELFADNFPPDTPSSMHVLLAQRYDELFNTDHTEALRPAVLEKAHAMLAVSKNPFGVYTFGPADNPNFFNTPGDKGGWHVGTSSHLLEGAAFMALAYEYEPEPGFIRFIYDQFNWTLGMNPYNISLMEGVGSAFAPTYHHRYTFAGVPRGAVPGGVVNGITWRSVADDRPLFDMSGVDIPAYESNEVWLPHNTALLNALAELMRVRD